LTIVHLKVTTTAEAAVQMSEQWMQSMKAKTGWVATSGCGLVFAYTDPSGLPAEVYGPVA
jgi:hypothetical protein